jgi:uncharacterized protein (TIGR03067 family)
MKALRFVGVGLVVLAWTAGAASAGGEREEQLRLQGEWRLVKLGVIGTAKTTTAGRLVVISGDKMAFSPKTEYALRLYPTRQPREIDLTITNDGNRGKVLQGIYKLEGDTFTIHYALPGGKRPANFEDAGAEVMNRVMVYQRVKADKGDRP